MLPLIRDKKNILFIELDLKETSGAYLTQIPPAGYNHHHHLPPIPLLCPGEKRDRSHPLILRARWSAAESPSLYGQAWFPADPPANVDVDVL